MLRTQRQRPWRIPADMINTDGSRGETLPLLQESGLEIITLDGKPNPRFEGEFIQSYLVEKDSNFEHQRIKPIRRPSIDSLYSHCYELVDSNGNVIVRYAENPVYKVGIAIEVENPTD